jgi:PilZ domain
MLKLSSQQFGRIVDALTNDPSAKSSAGAEKRTASRIDINCQLMLAGFTGDKVGRCYQALAKDISVTGIGLMQSRSFTKDERFIMSLPFGKGEEFVVICQATFCRPLTEGIHWCGAQFDTMAAAEVITSLRETLKAKKIENAILG